MKKLNPNEMYPHNIYIKNYDVLANDGLDAGVSLDTFDNQNNLPRDNMARAEYYHWLSVKLNDPKYLGYIAPECKKALGLE